jgi:hypothetical protein
MRCTQFQTEEYIKNLEKKLKSNQYCSYIQMTQNDGTSYFVDPKMMTPPGRNIVTEGAVKNIGRYQYSIQEDLGSICCEFRFYNIDANMCNKLVLNTSISKTHKQLMLSINRHDLDSWVDVRTIEQGESTIKEYVTSNEISDQGEVHIRLHSSFNPDETTITINKIRIEGTINESK